MDPVEDEVAQARRKLLGDAIVDDKVSPVASAARSAFRLGWEAALESVTQPAPAAKKDKAKHKCPRCGSKEWVSVSLDGGYTRKAQCVPCGKVHAALGPGWKAGG